jgi:hypothetical protein
MLFTLAGVVGGILTAFAAQPEEMIASPTFHFARAAIYSIFNTYMIKMSAVFMVSTSTIAIYTGIAPRWFAILGYVLAAMLLLGSGYIPWSFTIFPLWVLLLSIYILIDSLHAPRPRQARSQGKLG